MDDPTQNQVQRLIAVEEEPPKPDSLVATIFSILIFIAGLVVAGLAVRDWWQHRPASVSTLLPTPTAMAASPTSAVTTSSTPTPKLTTSSSPSPSMSKTLKIQVQNGTGTPGVAGKVKDILIAAGYQNVTTANAPNYDYTTSAIMAKTDMQIHTPRLKEVLSKYYTFDDQQNTLDQANPNDIVIIVGQK